MVSVVAQGARVFCSICGRALFRVSVAVLVGLAMGPLDGPTKTALATHIFVSRKDDYYQLLDELLQKKPDVGLFGGAPTG